MSEQKIYYSYFLAGNNEESRHKYQFQYPAVNSTRQSTPSPESISQEDLGFAFLVHLFDSTYGLEFKPLEIIEFVDFQYKYHLDEGGDPVFFVEYLDYIIKKETRTKKAIIDHPDYELVRDWISKRLNPTTLSGTKPKRSSDNKPKRQEISHKQQMLILHYLEVIEFMQKAETTTVKQAKLFSTLLYKSEQNTRDILTYINGGVGNSKIENKIKTKKNLKYVLELFIELELSDLAEKVEKDLKKLIERI